MNKLLALTLVAFSFLFSGQASAQRDPTARQAEMRQKMIRDLQLTDAQADSVVSINHSTMPQRRALFQDQSLSRDDKRKRIMAMTDSSDTRIKSVLGDSLFTKYKDWQKNNRPAGRMGGGRQGNQGTAPDIQ